MYDKKIQQSIMKWRQTHKEEYNEYCKNKMKEYYEKNKDDIMKRRIHRKYVKDELHDFNNIMLN